MATKRSESFLGIHFDFHAGPDCTEIGKSVEPAMVQAIIDAVNPDYVQTDCKGHAGFSSYPTEVGNQAPGYVKDTLRIWRDVTAKAGVGLYLHYSGVWDAEALRKHPDWARTDETGALDPRNTSVFGPYVDELLIPQLKELRDEYGVDGVWIDGECWATCQDYGPKVMALFEEETGVKLPKIPKTPSDPWFFEYTEFCREGFRRYLKHYVDELHQHDPEFQIASNWAYSSFMPEPVNIDVDFISGDYTLINSINSARLEGRYMASQSKPWDLMAWAFSSRWEDGCRSTKSIPQLQQEASVVLALGGGFQAYFTQKRDGGVRLWQMDLMAEVARFCRARQEYCHKAKAIPQVALLLSSADYYRRNPRIASPWNGELEGLKGILQALLESQYSVEVVSEHHLTGRLADYPVVVVPEAQYLDEVFRKELLDYVKDGGNLLVVGVETSGLFEKELGVEFGPISDTALNRWVRWDGWMGGLTSRMRSVTLGDGVQVVTTLHHDNDPTSESQVGAISASYGRGRIGAILVDVGRRYAEAATDTARKFISGTMAQLFPHPMVEVKGSKYVDVSLMTKDGKTMLNLVNTAGPHGDDRVYVFDEIPPVGPLEVTVRVGQKPAYIIKQPGDEVVNFTWKDGSLSFVVDRLAVYDIYVIG